MTLMILSKLFYKIAFAWTRRTYDNLYLNFFILKYLIIKPLHLKILFFYNDTMEETWHFDKINKKKVNFDKDFIIKFNKWYLLVKISKIWHHKNLFFRNLKTWLTFFFENFFLKIEFYDVCHIKTCQKIRKLKKSWNFWKYKFIYFFLITIIL